MERYRTSGVLDEAALNEIKRYLVSKKVKWLARILAAAYVLIGLTSAIAKGFLYMAISFVLAALFAFFPRFLANRFVKINTARLKESYPDGARIMESYFGQDGMVVINRSGGENVHMLYSAFFQVTETEHYFFVSTKAGQFCLVFKSFLTSEERASFIPFFREKCPNIKVKAMRQ